ncbi:alpha-L-fucosidase [Bacteroides sp.]
MKSICSFLCVCLFTAVLIAQPAYKPEWKSIDKRPIPAWFENAKFGIFIHWGLYSVPAWSPKGTYSEWYKYWLDNKKLFGNGDFTGTEIYDYHVKTYGEDFTYADFAPMFKAQDYDADAWAKLFEESGAKYVVLTTKHHDGFALWPSMEASRDYGRPWNSVEIGAKRDLVGEYTKALRKTDVKVGFYFSCREWDNPLYHPETMDVFVDRHFYPQLKDLISRYQPDLLWSDGPDNISDSIWKSKEFMSWLYSESEIKDSVVINDRWARFTDGKKHGDYYTREYSSGNSTFDKPWEECRGMGFSFGYNQNEDLEDYATPQALIFTLANIVSKGGNLLLDIGPNANGKILPIMQERLLQMGEWLKVNGEAIYGSRMWRQSSQWSDGRRDWKPGGKHYVSGNAILKQTVDLEPGYAVHEAFFTSKGTSTVYAILPRYPKDVFVLRGVRSTGKTKITLLGSDKPVQWEQKGKDIHVTLPVLTFDELPCRYAWTLKMEHVK